MRIIKGNGVKSPGLSFKSCIKMCLHIKEKYHFCEKKIIFYIFVNILENIYDNIYLSILVTLFLLQFLVFKYHYMAIDLFQIGKATLKHFLRVFKLTFIFCR